MRAIVNVSEAQLIVAYDGKERQGSMLGVVSEVSWNNPDLIRGLRQIFACRPNEEIVAVRINKDGIMVEIDFM